MRNLPRISITGLLDMVGLQPRRSIASHVLPGLGLLSLGLVAGAGLAFALAPHGAQTARKLVNRLGSTAGKLELGAKTTDVDDALAEVRKVGYGIAYVTDGYEALIGRTRVDR